MAIDPIIGKKLGDYAIQSLLGRGGMARVYKGYDAALDRYAAVKVFSGDLVAGPDEKEYRERFQREARAIARLHHPHIVTLYQFGEMDGLYYMAMAFLDGQDLRVMLKKHAEEEKRIPPVEILKMARQVASALDYAHSHGVIHRDIKPSNIMMTSSGAVLTDFGLALNVTEGTMGDTFGSAHYIAPEQAVSSARAVPQSDLYSLGVVLYEALTGKVPFDDPSAMSVALKHLNDTPPPPSLYNPSLPPGVEQVIFKILSKDPQSRYQTGAELVEALEHGLAIEEDTAELSQQQLSRKRRKEKTATDKDDLPVVREDLYAPLAERARPSSLDSYLRSLQENKTKTGSAPQVAPAASLSDTQDAPPQKSSVPPARPASPTPEKKNRAGFYIGIVLLLLLLIGAIGGALLALGRDEDGDKQSKDIVVATDENTPEATEMVVVTEETPDVGKTLTEETPVTDVATAETVIPTDEPTNTPTSSATATVAPPTDSPTATATNTDRPTPSPTLSATNTALPSPSATESPTPTVAPEIQLVYTDRQIYLRNLSSRNQNIGNLIFVGEQTGEFEAIDWQPLFGSRSSAIFNFRAGSCLALLSRGAFDAPSECRFENFYLIRADDDFHFWRAAANNTFFSVFDGDELITQCAIDASAEVNTCEFALP